ncbi:MAG: redoxin domain-containing protein, partial [Cyanobacteria bacterium J06573_2]
MDISKDEDKNMDLRAALSNFQAEFKQKIPAEVAAIMEKATNELFKEFENRRLIRVGDIAPDFTLPNPVGNEINLKERLIKGPVILTFYRGGWCPYCNL